MPVAPITIDPIREQAQSIALELIGLKGELKSSARKALSAVGKIDQLLEAIKKIESQGN